MKKEGVLLNHQCMIMFLIITLAIIMGMLLPFLDLKWLKVYQASDTDGSEFDIYLSPLTTSYANHYMPPQITQLAEQHLEGKRFFDQASNMTWYRKSVTLWQSIVLCMDVVCVMNYAVMFFLLIAGERLWSGGFADRVSITLLSSNIVVLVAGAGYSIVVGNQVDRMTIHFMTAFTDMSGSRMGRYRHGYKIESGLIFRVILVMANICLFALMLNHYRLKYDWLFDVDDETSHKRILLNQVLDQRTAHHKETLKAKKARADANRLNHPRKGYT